MNQAATHDRTSPLFAELRRFTKYRWFAGLTLIMGAVTNSYWGEWADQHSRLITLGGGILAYNVLLWLVLWQYRARQQPRVSLISLAWIQLLLDFFCLALLVTWTNGVSSPLIGLFVLHMVFVSILLSPSFAFLGALTAIAMVSGSLYLTGQWPATRSESLIGIGWMVTLLLTVHLTNHITQSLRRREHEFRNQNQRIRAILDTAADGIVTIDQNSIIQSVNPAAEKIFCYEAEELIGENINILMPEPFRSQHDGYIREYLRTGVSEIIGSGREVVGRRSDGTVFPLDAAVSVVPQEQGMHFTAIVRDITDRREAEDRLHHLNEELKRQQKVLVQNEKMTAMGQMAAGIAHEISNPLASMDGLLQLIKRFPDRMNDDSVDTLRQQIDRIRLIIQQMKAFAHPDQAGWESVRLNDVVSGALEMVRFDHRIRDVEITTDFSSEVGRLNLIPHAIQQVLVNMILNALDAMDGVEAPKLTLITSAGENEYLILISDNGQGIEADQINHIFEPFFTTKPVGRGTGLGLSISFSLIQQHHGTCEVKSQPGQGTTFTIKLPRNTTPSTSRESKRVDIPRTEKP